ncbi:NB-ARC domain-containing protein [Streptomyces sp. NPDC059101]|uniref:tetratricopeptide repeat protein n=1 Tax=Streptomyces sp. NPDC059101 TaxID=3346728 RepID=UPI0036920613
MDDRSAAERLAAELRQLRTNAGAPTFAQIAGWGAQQRPPVTLGKSKLSQWFSGKGVPEDGRPFAVLVELLEARAQQRSGTSRRGLAAWRARRNAADQERRREIGEGTRRTAGEGLTASGPSPGTYSVRPPYGELPVRLRGRDSLLTDLEWALAEGHEQVQVLHGLGGCGKTTVALRLAQHARNLGHQVFWVSATTNERLLTGMFQIARELGVADDDLNRAWAGRSSALDLVWRCLDRADQRWLLVVDAVDDLSVVVSEHGSSGDGTGWIRPSRSGLTVVTSRVGNPLLWGTEAVCRAVDMLSAEDGARVLADLTGNAGPVEDARTLAARLGGLPLALHLAGAYLAKVRRGLGFARRTIDIRTIEDFAGYTAELDRLGAPLLDAGEPFRFGVDDKRVRRLVSHTWEISLDLLAQQGLPGARLLMRVLSCFAPSPFPTTLLAYGLVSPEGEFPEGFEHGDAAVDALIDVGLLNLENVDVSVGGSGKANAVNLCLTAHPLVLDINAAQVRNGDGAAEVWRAAANVARWMGGGTNTPDRWKRWQVLVPHVLAALRSAPSDDVESLAWFVEVGWAAHGYCLASNSLEQADELLRLMMERAAALPETRPVVGAIRGQYYEASGDVDESRRLFEETRAERGPQDMETLQFQFRWARALESAGQLHAAEAQLCAVLDELRSNSVSKNSLLVHAVLVQVLARQGKDERAAAEAQALLSVVETDPAELDVTVLHQVGHALAEGHQVERAESAYGALLARLDKEGEQLSPLYRDISLELLGLLLQGGRERAAIALISRLLSLYMPAGHDSRVSLVNLADLIQTRLSLQLEMAECCGVEDELQGLLRDQLRVNGGIGLLIVELRIALVRVFIAHRDFAQAQEQLELAEEATVAAESGTVPLWTIRLWGARFLCAQDRCTEAQGCYEQVVALLAHDPDGMACVAKEAAGCLAAALGGETRDGAAGAQ